MKYEALALLLVLGLLLGCTAKELGEGAGPADEELAQLDQLEKSLDELDALEEIGTSNISIDEEFEINETEEVSSDLEALSEEVPESSELGDSFSELDSLDQELGTGLEEMPDLNIEGLE